MTQHDMDDNELARFLDRTLSEEERGSAVAHLSVSHADAELLADAAFVLRELDPEGGVIVDEDDDADAAPHYVGGGPDTDPKVVPLSPPSTRRGWRRAPARWLALAAMVAGVLLVPLALSRSASAGSNDFAVLLKDREDGLPAGWTERPRWSVTRGGGDLPSDRPPQSEWSIGHGDGSDSRIARIRAVRLGALHTDLALTISAGQADETRRLSAQIEQLLVDVPAAGAVAGYYRDIAARAGGPKEELTQALKDVRKDVVGFVDANHFGLGAWAEAARIAAASRDATFFRRRASRKMLDRAALLPSLDGEARATLEAIRNATRTDQPDWSVLGPQTTKLLWQIGS